MTRAIELVVPNFRRALLMRAELREREERRRARANHGAVGRHVVAHVDERARRGEPGVIPEVVRPLSAEIDVGGSVGRADLPVTAGLKRGKCRCTCRGSRKKLTSIETTVAGHWE